MTTREIKFHPLCHKVQNSNLLVTRAYVEIKVKSKLTIDWSIRELVRAKIGVVLKLILRIYGYPPSQHELATKTVLEQAELICEH